MSTPVLSSAVRARIDDVIDNDVAAQTAIEAYYTATSKLEDIAPDLFSELDNAFCILYDVLRHVAWADGYACGRNPDKLVFAVEPAPEPIAVDWVPVPGADGVSIAVSASAAVDAWLGGAQ